MADGLFDPSRLYDALKQYNLLPSYGNFSPPNGNVGVFRNQTNSLIAPSRDTDTMAHEMTHAVQFNLLKEAAQVIQKKKQAGQSLTDQEKQYLRASEQLFNEQYGNVYNYDRSKDVQDTASLKKFKVFTLTLRTTKGTQITVLNPLKSKLMVLVKCLLKGLDLHPVLILI